MIDAKLGGTKEGYFHEKKISLLSKEDKIEDEFEKQVNWSVIDLLMYKDMYLYSILFRPCFQ